MEIENLKQNERISDLESWKNQIYDLIYPIGSIYITENNNFDPNDFFYGTWTRNGYKGYVLVGATKTGEDVTANGVRIENGESMGEAKHTLTVEELPAHSHLIDRIFEGLPGSDNWAYRASSEYIGGKMNTGETGSSQPHNNIQPSIGVYIWHRTA